MKPKRKKWSEVIWICFMGNERICHGHSVYKDAVAIASTSEGVKVRKIKLTEV